MSNTGTRRTRRLDALVLAALEVDDVNVSVDGTAGLELSAPNVRLGADD